jgi:hypothetical protein
MTRRFWRARRIWRDRRVRRIGQARRIRRLLAGFALLSLFFGARVRALDVDSDAYGDIAAYLDGIYGAGDNAGLTAFPLLNIPAGGRAEGMASSFAAVADDASFLEFNPAASSRLDRGELAFFHNNWIGDTKIEGLVFTRRFGDLGLAAGAKWLYTPFTEYGALGARASKGYYSEAELILNGSGNFFSKYDFSGLALGFNLKGAFRFVPDFADQSGAPLAGSGREQSAAMLMADLGALTRFDLFKFYRARREKNSSLGLVIRNLGPPSKDEGLPTTLTAALAYKPLRPLLLSFDFSLPLNLRDPALSEKPYWAAGLALDLTDFLSMRGGVLMKSGAVRLVLGSSLNITKNRQTPARALALDLNYSVDLLTRLQPLNRLSLGLRLDLGDQGRAERARLADALYLEGLDAYALNRYREARDCWQKVLELDRGYLPAIEALALAEASLALQRRLDSLRQLNF